MAQRNTDHDPARVDAAGDVRPDRRQVAQTLLAGGLVLLTPVLVPGEAEAKKRGGRRPRGAQVYITRTQPPRLPTEQALLRWARGNKARALDESTEADVAQRKWTATLIVAFRQNVTSLEYGISFYDRGRNGRARRTLVTKRTYPLNSRDDRALVQRLQMPRPQFRPDRHYEVVVTVRRTEMGAVRVHLRGQPPPGAE